MNFWFKSQHEFNFLFLTSARNDTDNLFDMYSVQLQSQYTGSAKNLQIRFINHQNNLHAMTRICTLSSDNRFENWIFVCSEHYFLWMWCFANFIGYLWWPQKICSQYKMSLNNISWILYYIDYLRVETVAHIVTVCNIYCRKKVKNSS